MLDDRARAILAFEREWWAHAGRRDEAVRERFGADPADYRRELNRLIDRPEALAADPRTVARLRRGRARRVEDRTRRRAS